MARDIYGRYKRSCEKRSLEPISSVLESCKSGSSTLNLSGNCVSVENCRILAKTLQHGHPFTEIDFSDCLIGDEGLSKMMEFLRDDDQITSIILKGNSIKSLGAHAIADLLKRNISLEKLSLEWNSIGVHESDVKLLCEGLGMNTSLRCLDLRSNHIDHMGAAHIANTLLINTTLQELDLRWNNLGVLGGRKVLAALRSNSSLVRLQLEGNNIPSDITDAIGTTLSLRVSQQLLEAQHLVEAKQLSAQLSQLQTDSQHKMMEVLDTLDSERTAFLQTTQLSQCEIADLKSHLEERDTTIARLESKLLEVRGALRTSLSKSEELDRHLEDVTSHASDQEQALRQRIEQLEKEVVAVSEKGRRESIDASGRERTAKTKIHSLELEVEILQGNLTTAGQDWEVIKMDLKSRLTSVEARLNEKDAKHRDELKQLQESHQKRLSLQVEDSTSKEAALMKKIQDSEECVMKLEKAVKASRVQREEERGKAAEEVERLQQTIKLQTMKTGHMEDQMEELKSTQRNTVESLRSTISQQQAEKERLEEKYESSQQKLKVAHQELESERRDWERSRKGHKEEVKELTEEKDALTKEVKRLKKCLEEEKRRNNEAESRREGEMSSLRSEKAQLKERVEQQRATIQRFQQDEQQRVLQLKTALNNYFSATPKLSESDRL